MTGTDATRRVTMLCKSGWTRSEIAHALSVSVYALDKWRTGKHAPLTGTAKALRALKARRELSK